MTKTYKDIKECGEKVSVAGTVTSLINYLQGILDEFGDSAYIEEEYCGYDGCIEPVLYYTRKETDKEYDKRLAENKKARERKKKRQLLKEEKEKELLERLKKKYD
jgi:hypothetical protein